MARRSQKGRRVFLLNVMSLLSDFFTSAHSVFQSVTGTENLSIGGGTAIAGKFGESQFSRDYESGGFEQSGTLEFVTSRAQFVAAYTGTFRSYEGKSATARSETWRVASVNVSDNFVRIGLIVPNKSS